MSYSGGVYVDVGGILGISGIKFVEVQVDYVDRGGGTTSYPATLKYGDSIHDFPDSLQVYLDDLSESTEPLDKILALAFVEAHKEVIERFLRKSADEAMATEYEPGRPDADYARYGHLVFPRLVIDRAYVDKVIAAETPSLGALTINQ